MKARKKIKRRIDCVNYLEDFLGMKLFRYQKLFLAITMKKSEMLFWERFSKMKLSDLKGYHADIVVCDEFEPKSQE